MWCQLPQQLRQLRVHPVWSLDSKLVTLTTTVIQLYTVFKNKKLDIIMYATTLTPV